MIIYKITIGIIILALIFIGKKIPDKKHNSLKWLIYILAALTWGAELYLMQSNLTKIILSALSIGFFILIVDSFLVN